jgi:diguanylate cyclase (GGDEF)-like protein
MEEHDKTSVAMKVLTRDIMQFIKGNDQSYMSPLQNLSWFGIENAYIYIFEKPVINVYQEEFILPDKLYLMATLKNGEIKSISANNQETLMKDIFAKVNYKEDSLPKILFPLYSNESVYGVILCDMVETFYETGDFFVNQMSAAVKVIDLLKTNETIQEQLEDSILTLKENNIELNSLSRQDTLTGIFNRRGFYDAAETFVQYNKKYKCRTLVAYVDMNNLKIVNDRYGHDEGDFSIKKIAEFLQEVVGEKGVVGRLGGDEFAFVMLYEDECDMKKEIYSKFQAYNKTSPKEYNVSVSAGLCLLEPDSEMTLGEALTHADEMMYEEKKHKVKKVTK